MCSAGESLGTVGTSVCAGTVLGKRDAGGELPHVLRRLLELVL